MRLADRFSSCLFLTLLVFAVGCGGGSVGEYDLPTSENKISATGNVRTWLEGVAATGVIDSGVTIIPEQIDQMEQEGVSNAAEIKTDVAALAETKGEAAIKSKAKSILAKLPAE